MVEFEVDMACLLEDGELDRVVLHDENGEHPSMQFEPSRETCHLTREAGSAILWTCDECGSYHEHMSECPWEFCPRCGRKADRI